MQEIAIRHSEERDIIAIKRIYESSKVYSDTLQLLFPSVDKWKQRLNDLPRGFHNLVAEIDEVIVGHVGIETMQNPRRRHVAVIGIAVGDAYQGKGVGSDLLRSAIDFAENWLNVNRLELTVFVDNDAAIALYKKYGFATEGEMVAYAFRNGKYVNVYQMAKVKALPAQ